MLICEFNQHAGGLMNNKPTVWFVDDLPENLEKFKRNHSENFKVRTFNNIIEVLAALKKSMPDALLCDVFFFDTLKRGKEVEDQIELDKEQIEGTIKKFDLRNEKYHDGIKLIEEVIALFKLNQTKPPFPIYAYTSKGPYVFSTEMLDRIEKLGARILFKNRLSKDVEALIINREIEELKLDISSNSENKQSPSRNVHVMPHWTQYAKRKRNLWKYTSPLYYLWIIIKSPFKKNFLRIIYWILLVIGIVIAILSADYSAINENLRNIIPWIESHEKVTESASGSSNVGNRSELIWEKKLNSYDEIFKSINKLRGVCERAIKRWHVYELAGTEIKLNDIITDSYSAFKEIIETRDNGSQYVSEMAVFYIDSLILDITISDENFKKYFVETRNPEVLIQTFNYLINNIDICINKLDVYRREDLEIEKP